MGKGLASDTPLPDMGQPIPANDNYRHFGGGQTQTTVDLAPGSIPCGLCSGTMHISRMNSGSI